MGIAVLMNLMYGKKSQKKIANCGRLKKQKGSVLCIFPGVRREYAFFFLNVQIKFELSLKNVLF